MSTSVYFFGGYEATQADIDLWLRSARQQKPNIAFFGFRWPESTPSTPADKVVKGSRKDGQFKSALDAIQADNADRIYIVGHSSGCAIANAVDNGLKDKSKLVLVSLDGFIPDGEQLKRSTTQVWAAICDGVKSRNYHEKLGSRLKVYQATDCKTGWALHFSVVNAAATDRLVPTRQKGYLHCQANLVWL
ncbi:MAG: hypothetical protein U0790_29150 [Isosphaeraceae bacterium]